MFLIFFRRKIRRSAANWKSSQAYDLPFRKTFPLYCGFIFKEHLLPRAHYRKTKVDFLYLLHNSRGTAAGSAENQRTGRNGCHCRCGYSPARNPDFQLKGSLREIFGRLPPAPELSIKEISAQTGYSNALNFATAFRKLFGESLREYRKDRLNRTYRI